MPARDPSLRSSFDGLETLRDLSLFLSDLHEAGTMAEGATRIIADHSGGGAVRLWLAQSGASCRACPTPEVCARQISCLGLAAAAGHVEGISSEPECVPLGRGIAGLVAASKNEMLVPDVRGLQDPDVLLRAQEGPLLAYCGYPLVASGRLIGVLGLQLANLPRPQDQRALTTMAQILAQALGASFLRADQEGHARELEEKIEAKTAELKARVSDLEEMRLGMLNMMSDAFDAQRRLEALTGRLEGMVEERTRELVLAKEEAERANAMKSRFLGRVSHELRTPMHGIISFARLGVQKIDRSNRDKNLTYFQQILESAGELLPLIDDLLDISRIEADKVDYDFRGQDLKDLVRDIAAKQAALLAERQLRLETSIASDFPPEVVFDRKHMRQLLHNLVGNAAKFSPPGSLIEIALGTEGDDIVVVVADQGPGIPESELESIFDSFAQSSVTRGKIEGAGLGLAIARAVALDHGGSISCVNRPEGGASFRVRWPIGAAVEA